MPFKKKNVFFLLLFSYINTQEREKICWNYICTYTHTHAFVILLLPCENFLLFVLNFLFVLLFVSPVPFFSAVCMFLFLFFGVIHYLPHIFLGGKAENGCYNEKINERWKFVFFFSYSTREKGTNFPFHRWWKSRGKKQKENQ